MHECVGGLVLLKDKQYKARPALSALQKISVFLLVIAITASCSHNAGDKYVKKDQPDNRQADSIIFAFDSEDDIDCWSDGGSWDYGGGLTIGYDSGLKAMRLDLDYTGNSSSSWSEAKVKYSLAQSWQMEGYNRFSFDFIYSPSNMNKGSFSVKLSAGTMDAHAPIENITEYGGGLKMAEAVLTLAGDSNTINSFIIGLAGVNTDYKGPVYIDNIAFSKVTDDGYVGVSINVKSKMPVRVNSGSIVAGGQTQNVRPEIKLVDSKARDFTVKLAAYLEAIGKTNCVLFGHQNDITHKAGSKSLSNSDSKDVTGSIAAVMGIDTLSLTGGELASAAWDMPLAERVAAVRHVAGEAAEQCAIITLSAHMPNFEIIDQRVKKSREGKAGASDSGSVGILSDGHYNFSGYTPLVTTGGIVRRIMPGGDLNYLYVDYMDMIAACAKALEGDNISVLFRPFHECTGSWFWWGKDFCSPEEYKDMFRYTVEYLRDIKSVHNFIYVYGPGSEAKNNRDYAVRYPGDDYADMVGFDMYHPSPAANDKFIVNFKKQLDIVQQFAWEHDKLFAVTETGVSNKNRALLKTGNARKDWFNEILDAVSPTDASYFLVWANFGENSSFYTPYVMRKTGQTTIGHEMLDNFIDFYNDPRSVFAAQMGDYTKLSVRAVQP